MAEISVMVLLHHLKQFLPPVTNLPILFPPDVEDHVRWLYNMFEIMLGFLIKGRFLLTDELNELAVEGEPVEKTVADSWNTLLRKCNLALLDAEEAYEDEHHWRRALVEEINELGHEAEEVVETYFSNLIVRSWSSSSGTKPLALITEKLQKGIEGAIDRINNHSAAGGRNTSIRFEHESTREKAERTLKQSLPPSRVYDRVPKSSFEKENLVDRLLFGGQQKRSDLHVIAVVGDTASGKTTLARQVYNDDFVQYYYTSRGWVSVQNRYSLRNLLLRILLQFMVDLHDEIYHMDESQLKQKLFAQLSARRFLLVLDDAQNCHDWWDKLKDAFPQKKTTSRIILICNEISELPLSLKNARHGSLYSSTHNEYRAYDCFKKYVSSGNRYFFQELMSGEKRNSVPYDVAERMVNSCETCSGEATEPRIRLMASILKGGEKNSFTWAHMVARLEKRFFTSKDTDTPDRFLSACYHEIPQYLKPYFLYLSVFYRDTEISVKQLIQLWIAEGLILPWMAAGNTTTTGQQRTMEDVGEDYLDALFCLNLIRVIQLRSDGRPKSCRLNDLLSGFCVDMSLKEDFIEVLAPRRQGSAEVVDESIGKKPSRLSIHDRLEEYVSNFLSQECNSSRHVRSFSCFSQDAGSVSSEDWASLLQKFPLLRVLNLGQGELSKLPKEAIQHLSHLRYIKVRSGVHKSIFKLWNLQTLDLRTGDQQFPDLPEDIWMMKQLRHLYVDGPSRLPNVDEIDDQDDRYLPNLQTLSCISVNSDDEISKRAPNLKKLGLYEYECFSGDEQESTFNRDKQESAFNLTQLQTLKFAQKCAFEVKVELPRTVTKITVKKAQLKPNVIEMFGELPNLQILKLVQTSFGDDTLVFGKDSFPQLQLLKFEDSNLVSWTLEKGAIQKLRRLVIIKCPQLSEPQPGLLQALTSLEELEFIWTSMTFVKKLNDEARELKKKGLKIHVNHPVQPAAKA